MHRISHYLWYCHRLPDRSFFYRGTQFPVCARCTGIWVGYVIGLLVVVAHLLPWWSGFVLLLPALIDGGTQLLRWRSSTNDLRLVTGIALGIGETLILIKLAAVSVSWGYATGQWLLSS